MYAVAQLLSASDNSGRRHIMRFTECPGCRHCSQHDTTGRMFYVDSSVVYHPYVVAQLISRLDNAVLNTHTNVCGASYLRRLIKYQFWCS